MSSRTSYPSDKAARVARFAAVGGGLLLLASAALITCEILLRRLAGISLVGVDEIAGYSFAIAMSWGFAHALFMGAHIRVDVVYLRLSAPVQRVLDVVALASFAGIMLIVVVKAVGTLAETLRLDAHASTPLATPLWLPQTLWLAGLIFFLVCLVLRLLDVIRAILTGDRAEAARLGAPNSVPQVRDS